VRLTNALIWCRSLAADVAPVSIYLASKNERAHSDAPTSVGSKMRVRQLLLACGVVLALQATATTVRADVCKSILEQLKNAADRATREVSATRMNLQEAASQVADDKRRISLIAQSCAASAEAAGVLKSYRLVVAECMGDREPGRSDVLDQIDRSISQIRTALDKACR
jgi:hypothetical protein